VSDYTVLRAAAASFSALLDANITASPEPDLNGVPIDLRSPQELEAANVTKAVSLWPYRISVLAEMLNAPPRRLNADTYLSRPMPLELLFLITALHKDPATRLALVGRVIQVIDDFPRLSGTLLTDSLAGSDAQLRVSLDTTTLTESTELWYSLDAPFHLAVPVRMQVCLLDSQLPSQQVRPVLHRRAQIDQLIGT
jgi:hypothetical protein